MALQLKCPPSLATTTSNSGSKRPFNPFSFKSSSFIGSLTLLLHPNQHHLITSSSPRISMRVASKDSYICRDCGYIYNERTSFEKLPDKYFCPGASNHREVSLLPRHEKNGKLQFVVLQKEGLGLMHQLFQKMQMLQMLESLEKQKSREKNQLGKHFLLQLLWEL